MQERNIFAIEVATNMHQRRVFQTPLTKNKGVSYHHNVCHYGWIYFVNNDIENSITGSGFC
jgi:hypothetical protein